MDKSIKKLLQNQFIDRNQPMCAYTVGKKHIFQHKRHHIIYGNMK